MTEAKANSWLDKVLFQISRAVHKYEKYYTFNQNQFDALVSFAYNLGTDRLNTLLQNGTRPKELITKYLVRYKYYRNEKTNKME
ncbi:hypothetical protein ELE67_29570, partial [Klebsiella pneumoniae]|nr:hypothetical protein [Klebsiella pneumoniae]